MNFFTKALSAMRHAGPVMFLLGRLARTKFDYAKEVGTGVDASVVMAPIQWIQRAFPDARLRVTKRQKGQVEEIDKHPLPALIDAPNPFYTGAHLWAATLFSSLTAGNAYWLKVKTIAGKVVQLWYVPHWAITAKWPHDGMEFISHYEYRPGGGQVMRLEPEDVVHFRHGIDPTNTRLGVSPLHSVIREIFMDLEASNFVASLLKNSGVPGVVISPDGDVTVAPDDAKAVKAWFTEEFGGDRRGGPLVMAAKTKVQQYGFSPQQMDLSVVRNVAEERVCAALGIPAAVVGFGSGLETAKVGATMNELRRLAWINGVIPLHRAFALELRRSLLPDFRLPLMTPETVVDFDFSEVTALEEDLNERAKRLDIGVKGGWVQVAEARAAMGFDVDESHRIFLRGLTVIEVPGSGAVPRLPPLSADDDDKGGKVIPLLPHLKAHTLGEERATGNPKRKPTQGQARYVAALARQIPVLSEVFEKRLAKFFDKLGAAASGAALPILKEAFKAAPDDVILAERILEALDLKSQEAVFAKLYEAHYITVAKTAGEAADLVGLATDVPDPLARAMMAAGGGRSKLVGLEKDARVTLFNSLTEGRAAGEGADALARRIRTQVPKGPWSDVRTRARVIARTETAYAQNISTIKRSELAGLERALVFDNRTGFDDDICPGLDGIEVTLAEAQQLASDEHPNGTRSFSPLVQDEL
jgi:HK97 family phage portal protein